MHSDSAFWSMVTVPELQLIRERETLVPVTAVALSSRAFVKLLRLGA